ncbi:uncharacterized protein TNCV_608651 [Trichonephila clavipes]|nr:uncharacterized protein TNCV_608651 [Trichonephila clavipes]
MRANDLVILNLGQVTRTVPDLATPPSSSNYHTNREDVDFLRGRYKKLSVAAVAEWYRYRTVACLVMNPSPAPPKTRRVGQRCTLNLSRAEMSSRWCGMVVKRGGASSGVVHVT